VIARYDPKLSDPTMTDAEISQYVIDLVLTLSPDEFARRFGVTPRQCPQCTPPPTD